MSKFFGYRSVLEDLKHHLRDTGKVRSGTLMSRGGADVFTDRAWKYSYMPPVQEMSGMGAGGPVLRAGTLHLWRMGETVAPRADDVWEDTDSNQWLIESVTPRLNADESNNYAIYDCQVSRAV